ncbi:MAG TPA: alpha/beta fold hydrolase [Xanthobacteraceae bacterium]|nr:alpha/beta fold hydrolase [Xanthobacteraceae bacterium]
MARSSIPNLSAALTMSLLRTYGKIAPKRFQRRFVQRFLTPGRPLLIARERPDLPPPDESMRIPVGGNIGLVSDTWVQAWRWGQGPAVLLVHGWEDDHHCFDAIIAALVKRGHAVVAFDLPAHGKSGGTQSTIPLAAQAVEGVAQAFGPVRAVAGHSLRGAAVAFAITESWLNVERVAGIAAPTGPTYMLNAIAKRFGMDDARKEALFEELKRVVGYRPEEIELMPRVAKLDLPALIVHSRDDQMVRFVTGEKWAVNWPGAQLHAVEKLGHRKLLFDPATAGTIADFLVQRSCAKPETKVA